MLGISINDPRQYHDIYCKDRDGAPSFSGATRGVYLLKKHAVEFNMMAVVNDCNADYPIELYNFFKEIGTQFIQFTPVVEMLDGKATWWCSDPDKCGDFFINIFNVWVRNDIGKYFIQYFDSTLVN